MVNKDRAMVKAVDKLQLEVDQAKASATQTLQDLDNLRSATAVEVLISNKQGSVLMARCPSSDNYLMSFICAPFRWQTTRLQQSRRRSGWLQLARRKLKCWRRQNMS